MLRATTVRSDRKLTGSNCAHPPADLGKGQQIGRDRRERHLFTELLLDFREPVIELLIFTWWDQVADFWMLGQNPLRDQFHHGLKRELALAAGRVVTDHESDQSYGIVDGVAVAIRTSYEDGGDRFDVKHLCAIGGSG
jgi:hypothetical protein